MWNLSNITYFWLHQGVPWAADGNLRNMINEWSLLDIWTVGHLMVILGKWSYNTYFRLQQGYLRKLIVILRKWSNIWLLVNIWIFGQLMVFLGKWSYHALLGCTRGTWGDWWNFWKTYQIIPSFGWIRGTLCNWW